MSAGAILTVLLHGVRWSQGDGLESDKKLLAQMQASLKTGGGHFSSAVLEIVKSRQFLNRRAEAAVAGNP